MKGKSALKKQNNTVTEMLDRELYKAECQCITNGVMEAWRHGTLGSRAEILERYFFVFD